MPELPEVETIRRGLLGELVGRRVTGVTVSKLKLRRPLAPGLAAVLRGRTVVGVGRRGKYLLAHLDNGMVWVIHLGMSGRLLLSRRGGESNGHVHLRARLDDGRELIYSDPRRFGLIMVGDLDTLPGIGLLGVEPFSSAYSPAYLHRRCHQSRRTIKDLLMDQRIVAGLGNIYVNEILFAARVRPSRRAFRITLSEAQRLVKSTHEVLSHALDAGGSSISDFRHSDGVPGSFQDSFLVYGRAGESCFSCGGVIRCKVIGGRSSFYCPRCQR